MSMDNTFRQLLSPAPTLRHDRMNISPIYIEQEKSNGSQIQTYQLNPDRRNSKTIVRPLSSTSVRDTLDYTEGENHLYHIAKRERHKWD